MTPASKCRNLDVAFGIKKNAFKLDKTKSRCFGKLFTNRQIFSHAFSSYYWTFSCDDIRFQISANFNVFIKFLDANVFFV